LAEYQQALALFKKAITDWKANAARNPTQTGKYKAQIDRCEKATKWITAMCESLVDVLAPSTSITEMHIPATDGKDYKLVRLKLASFRRWSGASVQPRDIRIKKGKYQLCDVNNGAAFSRPLGIPWNERYLFAVQVPRDRWAGPYSAEGDYVLVRQERQVTWPGDAGVLWDGDYQEWKYGEFVRDLGTGRIRFRPVPPLVIGGMPQEEEIEDKDIGIVRALLKPV
jgi:hypothetical protein